MNVPNHPLTPSLIRRGNEVLEEFHNDGFSYSGWPIKDRSYRITVLACVVAFAVIEYNAFPLTDDFDCAPGAIHLSIGRTIC